MVTKLRAQFLALLILLVSLSSVGCGPKPPPSRRSNVWDREDSAALEGPSLVAMGGSPWKACPRLISAPEGPS